MSPYERNESTISMWDDFFDRYADPRTTNWPLMESPFPMIAICVAYVLVMIFLPKWMETRKPFNMKRMQLLCNIWYLSFSWFFLYKASTLGWLTYYNWRCQPVDTSLSGPGYEVKSTNE